MSSLCILSFWRYVAMLASMQQVSLAMLSKFLDRPVWMLSTVTVFLSPWLLCHNLAKGCATNATTCDHLPPFAQVRMPHTPQHQLLGARLLLPQCLLSSACLFMAQRLLLRIYCSTSLCVFSSHAKSNTHGLPRASVFPLIVIQTSLASGPCS
jgi:hypothetical protein